MKHEVLRNSHGSWMSLKEVLGCQGLDGGALRGQFSSTEALPLEANVAATWWDELTQGARVFE